MGLFSDTIEGKNKRNQYLRDLLPRVFRTEGDIVEFDPLKIEESIVKETGLDKQSSDKITQIVVRRIISSGIKFLSGPHIREIVCSALSEQHFEEERKLYTRIGMPLMDYEAILEHGDDENANQDMNPESIHHWAANRISDEYALLRLLDSDESRAHLFGDIHVHMLRYFDLRPFCIDGNTKIPIVNENFLNIVKAKSFDTYFNENDTYIDISSKNLSFVTPSGNRKLKYVSRRKGDNEVYKIKTRRGKELLLSKDHNVMVFNNNTPDEVQAKDLRSGDKLMILHNSINHKDLNQINIIEELLKRCPDEILDIIFIRNLRSPLTTVKYEQSCTWDEVFSKAEIISFPRSWEKGNIPIKEAIKLIQTYSIDLSQLEIGVEGSTIILPALLNLEKSLLKLIGYFLSEGNYDSKEKENYHLVLTSKDSLLLEDMERCIKNTFNTYITYSIVDEKAPQIYFGGKIIFLLFRYIFGITLKSKNKAISDIFFNLSNKKLKSLFIGLFSKDGHVVYRPKKSGCEITYTSKSKELIDFIGFIYSLNKIQYSIKKEFYECNIEGYGYQYRIKVYGVDNILKLSKLVSFIQPEKQRKIEKFLQTHKSKYFDKNNAYETIIKITKVKPTHHYLYDFTLEGNGDWTQHAFYANNILIHNCQEWDPRMILENGLPPVDSWPHCNKSGPAGSLRVAVTHLAKWLGIIQGEFSLPYWEKVLIEENGVLNWKDIGKVVDDNINSPKEIYTFAFNPLTLKMEKHRITNVFKHKCNESFLQFNLEYGREITVTKHHSLFTVDDGDIIPIRGANLKIGDFIVVPKKINYEHKLKSLSIIELINKYSPNTSRWHVRSIKNKLTSEQVDKLRKIDKWANQHLHQDSIPFNFFNELNISLSISEKIQIGMARSPHKIPAIIPITNELLFLLGIYVAGGSSSYKYFNLTHGIQEKTLFNEIKQNFLSIFGIDLEERHPHQFDNQLLLDGEVFKELFENLFQIGHGAANKRVPFFIFGLKEEKIRSFLRGLFLGNAHCRALYLKKNRVRNEISGKTVSNQLIEDLNFLLLKIGIVPSINYRKDGNRISIYGKDYLEIFLQSFKETDLNWKVEQTDLDKSPLPLQIPTNHCGLRQHFGNKKELNHAERMYINQKQRIGTSHLKKILRKAPDSSYKSRLEKFLESDLTVLKIKKITQLPREEYAYDFEVTPNGESIENFIGGKGLIIAHNSGGQGYDYITTFLAPYARGVDEREIQQSMQCLIFETNQIFAARGGQVPFTSISCTPAIPDGLLEIPAVGAHGKIVGKYGDYKDECLKLFDALTEVYIKGDHNGKLFAFPKHEIKIKKEWLKEFEPSYLKLMEESIKMGTPYFLNMCPDWMPDEIHSQCCRKFLSGNEIINKCILDPEKRKNANVWENYVTIGSLQSVSLNLPRYAYMSKNEDDYFHILDEKMELSARILLKKWNLMEKRLKTGHLPLCSGKIKGKSIFRLSDQNLSIGYTGLNEAVKYLTSFELHETDEAYSLGKKILNYMAAKCNSMTERDGKSFSLWEQPAESSSNRLARLDLKHFPKKAIVQSDGKSAYYTNSSHFRYDADIALSERIKKQGDYHPIVSGGVITHIWLGEQKPDIQALWELTKNICLNTNTAYFAYTTDFIFCPSCRQMFRGSEFTCPKCKSKDVKVYSRITGYYSEVNRYNPGKKAEWEIRKREHPIIL